jgi:hypothetical protein
MPLRSRKQEIPKDGNKVRVLSIPAIRDRVVQGALKLIMEPIFGAPGKAWCFQRVRIPHRKGESHPTGNRALDSWR